MRLPDRRYCPSLRRLYVLVFISLGRRRVEYVACTGNPDGAWMVQQARNLLMNLGDRGYRPGCLIHERDAKFSHTFDAVFSGEQIQVVRTPLQAPNANVHIERWIGSLRRECLDRLLIVSRLQLEHTLRVYVRHHNQRRPHRALALQTPEPLAVPTARGDPRLLHHRFDDRTYSPDFPRIRTRHSMRPD